MALLHKAQLRPTKLEVLASWVPEQSWYRADNSTSLRQLAAFRFDDPAGEVGIETHLLQAGNGPVLQVPLTYRGEPMPGGEPWLIGTMEHSVLGQRWVYDGCGDPVYVAMLVATVLGGGTQSEEFFEVDGRREPREPTAVVRGSGGTEAEIPPIDDLSISCEGSVTEIRTDHAEVQVCRSPIASMDPSQGETLTGAWGQGMEPVVLAVVNYSMPRLPIEGINR